MALCLQLKFYQSNDSFPAIQEGTLSLCLCDTNAEEDIHINDELVSNEYAICPEINSPETSAAGQVCYPLAHYSYISCSLFKRDTFLRHTFLLMIFPHTLFP